MKTRQKPSVNVTRDCEHQIVVRDLFKSIGKQQILRGISLEIVRGETFVIIGLSGGGKSVLLKHLVGLMRPDSGSIRICDAEIAGLSEDEMSPIRRQIGILFQGAALFDSMTVYDNIAFPLREWGGATEPEIRERIDRVLELLGLVGHDHKLPVALSGGMRKRVGLARAIITQPSCVLYDEPTSGLDPVVSDSIDRLIRRLKKRLGMTSVVVTHDMKSVRSIADRVAYLRDGQIYFLGTADELLASDDPVIQDFVQGRAQEVELDD